MKTFEEQCKMISDIALAKAEKKQIQGMDGYLCR